MSNLFFHIPSNLPAELIETLIQSDGVRVERIVSHGHASLEGFWYDQDEHEWVTVLQGSARLQLEDRTIELVPGDYIRVATGSSI